MGEKERKRKRSPRLFLRSTEFRRSEFVKPRVKVHLLDEGYACVPKPRDLIKDPKEEIWRNKIFRV